MRKYFNIAYLLPLIMILIFIIGMSACNPKIGKPDIRKEFNDSKKPDYFGWKWDFKW